MTVCSYITTFQDLRSEGSSHHPTPNDICSLLKDGAIILRTSQDLIIGLYYADSYGLAASIKLEPLEPHKCTQLVYFCICQIMVIIGLANFAALLPG